MASGRAAWHRGRQWCVATAGAAARWVPLGVSPPRLAWARDHAPLIAWGLLVVAGCALWALAPADPDEDAIDTRPADSAEVWVVPQATLSATTGGATTGGATTVDPSVLAAPQAATTEAARAAVAQFRADLRAVSADLYATGRVSPGRARYLGYWIVAESYRQQVPPALVFGVMSVEDPRYRATARSEAGARGVMQVMPTVWIPTLGAHYGQDLTDDRTNLAMGVHILRDALTGAGGEWPRALLRYNGCVHGTRTPTCFDYPEQVRRRVERLARWSCPSRNFDLCVAGPLRTGWMERRWERSR